jgi:RHS repeat-associated protein
MVTPLSRAGLLVGILVFCSATSVIAQTAAPPPVPGTIKGTADVTLSGSASYAIPIQVAPGTGGTAPKLAIAYDSQAPNGPLGAGWSITGLSKITRGLKNLRTDNTIQGPHFDGTDALYLDGQRLIPVPPGSLPCGTGAGYVKEIDDQTCVSVTGTGSQGPTGFVVHTKAGLSMQYGMTADSQVKISNGTTQVLLLWACNRIEDSTGNYIDFHYKPSGQNDYNIDSIAYTGNTRSHLPPYATVSFTYDTVRPHSTFILGYEIASNQRLSSITTTTETGQVSKYALGYLDENTLNRFVLQTVTQYGSDGSSFNATKFTYSTALPTQAGAGAMWQQQSGAGSYGDIEAALTVQDNVANGYRFISINGKVHEFYSAFVLGKLERAAFKNTGSGFSNWSTMLPPAPFAINGEDLRAVAIDLDGDGHPYLFIPMVQQVSPTAAVWHFNAAQEQWDDVSAQYGGALLPLSSADGGRFLHLPRLLVGDFSGHGDGHMDILWDTSSSQGALINKGSGLGLSGGPAPPAGLNNAQLIDADCDGTKELAYIGGGRLNIYKAQPAHQPTQWTLLQGKFVPTQIPTTVRPESVREVGSMSGCVRLLVADGQTGTKLALVASSDPQVGWHDDTVTAHANIPFWFVDSQGKDSHAVIVNDQVGVEVLANWGSAQFAATLTPSGWTANAAPPGPLGSDTLLQQGIVASFVGDLNQDSWPDIVYFSNSRSQPNDVELSTAGTGWQSGAQYNPNVPFAKQGQGDLGVRFIDLHGLGRQDLIWSQDAPGAVAPGEKRNTGYGWDPTGDSLTPPVAISSVNNNLSNAVQFVDVDGDGYIDFVYGFSSGGTLDAKAGVYFNKPVTGQPGRRMWTPTPSPLPADALFGDKTAGDMGARLIDLDGDGRIDIIYSRMDKDGNVVTQAYLQDRNTGQWTAAPQYVPPQYMALKSIPFVVLPGRYNSNAYSTNTQVQLIDVNGDGLPDLVFNFADPLNFGNRVNGVCLNTGNGWQSFSDCQKNVVPVALDEINAAVLIQYVDLNGDGLIDIVVTVTGGATGTSTKTNTYLGSGTGWMLRPEWQIPSAAIATCPGDPGFRLADVNGDGLPDIVYNHAGGGPGCTANSGSFTNAGGPPTTGPAPGSSWVAESNAWASPQPFSLADGSDSGVRLVDLNGDGLPDILLSYNNTNGAWINLARRADVVTQVADGLGVPTIICYRTLHEPTTAGACNAPFSANSASSGSNAYDGGDVVAYPLVRGIPTSYVVTSMTLGASSDALTFSYSYGGLKFDALARRSLGFALRKALDQNKQILTTLKIDQGTWTVGQIDDTTSACTTTAANCNGVTLSNAHSDWLVTPRPIGPYTVATVAQSHTKVQKTDTDGSDLGRVTNDFTYDGFLNVTKLVMARNDRTSVTTINTYDNQATPNHWILGRLTRSTVTKVGDPGTRREVRRARFEYDKDTGLLVKEVTNPSDDPKDPNQLTIDYTRDPFGNITTKKASAYGEKNRGTIRVFDARGRFAISETNVTDWRSPPRRPPVGLTVKNTYSSEFGTVTSATAPDGTLTKYGYDGFGRLTMRTDPSGLVTTMQFTLTASPPASGAVDCPQDTTGINAAFATITVAGQLPKTCTYFDYRGRPIRKASQGFAASGHAPQRIYQETAYDAYGRVTAQTRAYFAGDAAPTITRTYDVLDRLTSSSEPSGEKITREYHGRGIDISHVITSTQTVHSKIETNIRNAPVKVTDPKGGITIYEYDAGERPTKITGPAPRSGDPRAVTVNEYDAVGRRISTTDPDMGTWRYDHNAFGQLTRQTDAVGQITTVEYDLLGRPTRRVVNQSGPLSQRVDSWTYDAGNHAGSHITSIQSTEGYREDYDYDSSGRQSGKKITIHGQSFYTQNVFDQYGRIASIKYPTLVAVDYTYDANGYLAAVADRSTRKVYWQADQIDALGRVTAEHFGNGAKTATAFDPTGGYMDRTTTTSPADGTIQDLELGYDVTVLGMRTDHVKGSTDRFTYDELQRLIRDDRGGGGSESYQYDGAGRFISKGAGRTYDYQEEPTDPYHAPSSVTDGSGQVHTFEYDANGNRTSGPYFMAASGGRTNVAQALLWYTGDNRLRELDVDPAHFSKFEYGPTGTRFRQYEQRDLTSVETLYAGLYEKDFVQPFAAPPIRRDRHYLVNQGGVFAVLELDTYGSPGTSLPIANPGSGGGPRMFYLHKDQLGSITYLTDEGGHKRAAYTYDPWGAQKGSTVGSPRPDPILASWDRGYTGHEEISAAHFVHMNGRVYDADAGIFVSPDLVTQTLTDDRTFNRYSYVLNNPLGYVDPTGYFHIGGTIGGWISSAGNAIGNAISGAGNALNQAGQWLQQNWREVVIITAAVALTVVTAGADSPILVGMLSGAALGGLSSALYGGTPGDILKAAAIGGLFGGLGAGIGEAFSVGSWESIAGQGALGGLDTAVHSGDFAKGFALSALTALGPDIQDISGFSGAALLRVGAQAALNGTISALEGDKFANGAAWGAFAQLQSDINSTQWAQGLQSGPVASLVDASQKLIEDATGLIALANTLPVSLKGVVAAAAFVAVGKFEVNFGPYDVQTNMMVSGTIQQMLNDPFAAGSIMFSSSTVVALTPPWSQASQSLGASYFASYGYGAAAIGYPSGGIGYIWQQYQSGNSYSAP